jgi:hypothetical protein
MENLATNEEIEDMKEEIAEEQKEEERELLEEMKEEDAEAYGVPEEDEKFDRMKFLTEVRDRDDTIRTTYLTKTELGTPLFPVRFWLNLELLAKLKKYDIVEDFLYKKALVTTHSGLSREGFLVNTTVTRRKEMTKHKPKQQEVKIEK